MEEKTEGTLNACEPVDFTMVTFMTVSLAQDLLLSNTDLILSKAHTLPCEMCYIVRKTTF